MGKYKAIVYDIDGTILNTLDMNMYPLLRIIKEELGEDWTYEEVLKFAPYPGMKVMEELQVSHPEKVYERWVRYVNEYEKGAQLFEGFETVFPSFQKVMKQGIVSAKTRQQYQIDIVAQGIDQYIDEAVLADDTTKHKPDPEPLLLCLDKLQLNKEDVIYIGDSYSDYQAAINAGVDFGYAKWGSVCEIEENDFQYTFESPIDLLKLIEES